MGFVVKWIIVTAWIKSAILIFIKVGRNWQRSKAQSQAFESVALALFVHINNPCLCLLLVFQKKTPPLLAGWFVCALALSSAACLSLQAARRLNLIWHPLFGLDWSDVRKIRKLLDARRCQNYQPIEHCRYRWVTSWSRRNATEKERKAFLEKECEALGRYIDYHLLVFKWQLISS